MLADTTNFKCCPYGALLVLLLTPFVSLVESHHHRERLLIYNGLNNQSVNSIDVSHLKIPPNASSTFIDTRQVRREQSVNVNWSPNSSPNSTDANYSAFNQSCYQCLYEQQLEAAIYKVLSNNTFHIEAKINDSCSTCLAGIQEFSNKTKTVGCMCGIYTTQLPGKFDTPLKTKVFENVSCHELIPFEDACKKVCILGTLSYNELEPTTLCYHIQSGTNIRAYLESKLCDDDSQWVFTGLASSTPICCDQGVPISCE